MNTDGKPFGTGQYNSCFDTLVYQVCFNSNFFQENRANIFDGDLYSQLDSEISVHIHMS